MRLKASKVRLLCLAALVLAAVCPASPALAAVIYVRPGAPADPPPDGSSWNTSFADPATALNQADAGDQVWIAEGTYYGRFEVKSGVAVYGGFAGHESTRDERQPDRYPTILDAARQAPCLQVLAGVPTTLLDGLVITNGLVSDAAGAGLRVEGASLVLNGVTFVGHQALEGAAVLATNSELTVTRCRFLQNTSYGLSQPGSHARGAALHLTGGRLHLEDCLFYQFRMYPSLFSGESGLGGAVWLEKAEGMIRGNTWMGCVSHRHFRATRFRLPPSLALPRLWWLWPAPARVVNKTFVANRPFSDVVRLGNTLGEVFANNILAFNDGGMDFSLPQTRFASNCVWEPRLVPWPAPDPQLLLVDPKLVNVRQGDVRLQFDSPMRGAADETFVDETLADLYGQPRRQGDRVGLGAAEGSPGVGC